MKMRHFLVFAAAAVVFTAFRHGAVYANARIDVSNAADGLVKYEYSGDLVKTSIHAALELSGGSRITPRMQISPSVLPLTMGTGKYDFKVLEKLPDGKAKVLLSESATLSKTPDETVIYTASNMNVNFEASKVCIPDYKKLTNGLSGKELIDKIYEEVVNYYTYDDDKAQGVINGTIKEYLPDIDKIYNAKKGICYDYSAVLGGALRSQGIPVKLCKGYAAELGGEFHAWNEIMIDGKWIVVDSTIDSSYAGAGVEYIFEKDPSTYKATSYS